MALMQAQVCPKMLYGRRPCCYRSVAQPVLAPYACYHAYYSPGSTTILVRWSASKVSNALTYRMRPLGLVCGLHPLHIQAVLWRFFYHLLSANKGREVQVIPNNLQPLPWVRLSAMCAAGTPLVNHMTRPGIPIIDEAQPASCPLVGGVCVPVAIHVTSEAQI